MTVTLPEGVAYGRVLGRFIKAILDRPEDEDALPDAIPFQGSLKFTSTPKNYLLYDEDETVVGPGPFDILLDAETGRYDEYIVATDETWNYRVDFNIIDLVIPSIYIDVPPGSIQKITDWLPIGTDPGTGETTMRGPRGYYVVSAVLTEDSELVFTTNNDEEINAGVVPGALEAAESAEAAHTSEVNAGNSATAAGNSATAAQTARTGAETARTGAETARTGAETARTGAETAKTGAEAAQAGAESARDDAEAAKTAAETAETNAESAATTATTKAGEADASADAAAASESAAAGYASTATTKAGEAAASASAADSSADAAAVSATAADGSADAAAASESAAAGYASTATTKAGEAAASASAADASADAAAASAVDAANSAAEAAAGGVQSVNGISPDGSGAVTLDADDIGDGTTNKSFTATEKTKLSGIETGADVTDATNVDAAGAVMNSDTSTASMSFVVDEDAMTSNSATKVPTQQSVKAYVDSGLSGKAATSHTQALSTISDVTASAAEVNVLDGITASTAELNYTDGVTSAIQTQLDGKTPTSRTVSAGTGLTGGGDLTANRTLAVDFGTGSGEVAQGNDSRITGAAQKANNLSDLASAATARANIGAAANTLGAAEKILEVTGSGTKTLDCSAYSGMAVSSMTGAVTVALSNVPATAGEMNTFTVAIVQDATKRTITWPTVQWAGGSAPVDTASKTTIATLWKYGTSSTIYGSGAVFG